MSAFFPVQAPGAKLIYGCGIRPVDPHTAYYREPDEH